jgi:retron-type reverse transcriptase
MQRIGELHEKTRSRRPLALHIMPTKQPVMTLRFLADNVTVEDYEEDLEANLRDLLGRLHRGSYRPRPSLRKKIPKGNGKTRALGIACVEDKLVQRAIVMILERIYGSNKKSNRGSKEKRT